MSIYKPPIKLTDKLINLTAAVCEEAERITLSTHGSVTPHLRRENRIKTIHASLAIEQNSLSLEQVTAILNGKRVLGNPNEIREVQNAYETYEMMLSLDPESIQDLLKAHKTMMSKLIPECGKFRSGGVGVFKGDKVVHMAPPAEFVPGQIQDLFNWYKTSEMHPFIKSSVFHYEFEFIHPFGDGNGRMGRLWHSMLLGKWKEIFYWLPIEELIYDRQEDYYEALGECDKAGESSAFAELMSEIILDTLKKITVVGNIKASAAELSQQVIQLLDIIGNKELSAAEIMSQLGLSHKPTFRKNYLNPAIDQGLVEMTMPDKPTSSKQKYRRK